MIDILMATYNGATYLRPQIESILRQSYKEWHLIIRDDCSIDDTVQIVREYQKKYPNKITLLYADRPSGSAQNNFYQLIKHWQMYGKANYVMFADQDDVWLPQKLQITLDKMCELESKYGVEIPLLVHTDLTVVDAKLDVINPSMFTMQNIDAKRNKLNNIIVQNIVTGCTMMVNCALLDLVQEIPQQAIMHDMWLALIATAFGQVNFVDSTTILYRQHGNNANGAKNIKSLQYMAKRILNLNDVHFGLVRQYKQALELERIYRNLLTRDQRDLLLAYGNLENSNLLKKMQILRKYSLYKTGLIRKLGQLLI